MLYVTRPLIEHAPLAPILPVPLPATPPRRSRAAGQAHSSHVHEGAATIPTHSSFGIEHTGTRKSASLYTPRTLEASLTGSCSPSWLYTLGDARTCSSDLASALRIDCASPARGRAKGAVPLQASTLCKAAARHERCSHGSCDTSRIRACSRCSRAWLSSANLAATARTFGVAGRPCGAAILEE